MGLRKQKPTHLHEGFHASLQRRAPLMARDHSGPFLTTRGALQRGLWRVPHFLYFLSVFIISANEGETTLFFSELEAT